MELTNIKLTTQMAKVFRIAEQECKMSQTPCLMPGHLLIGCMDDGSFPIKEGKQKSGIDIDALRDSLGHSADGPSYEFQKYFKLPVCRSTKLVIEQAILYMMNYNQIYLNEGHVLKALIKTGQTEKMLTQEQNNTLLNIATVSRNMCLDVTDYKKPHTLSREVIMASKKDAERLIQFINEEFGTRWTESIQHEFKKPHPSIFIAEDQKGDIVGFAAFDIHETRFFGPMGVAKNKRAEGIGESLLHICLEAMQEKGYKEIIIDHAGPIEFYEKTCNAKVIPLN